MYKKQINNARMKRVMDAMAANKFDGLIVSDPQSIWYLTGIYTEPYERLFALYLSSDGKHKFFLNKLFNVHNTGFEEIVTSDSDDFMGIMAQNISEHRRIGVDKFWAARFLIPLMKKNSAAEYVLGSFCVDDARACKDEEELRIMKKASHINDVCIMRAADYIKEGVTESDVAAYIDSQFKAEGAEAPSFTTIVSFGANAADPHHVPGDTVVQKGDCVLIDMGCVKDRYCSDMTRTFFYKEAPTEYTKIHDIVRCANETAEKAVKPGARFCDIDAAARNIIAANGYGDNFTHRLGHFIGQSDHEQGDVSAANTTEAKVGMVFSIEPGIYLPGKFGVRIEDLVAVTKDGCEILNSVDKHWKVIG